MTDGEGQKVADRYLLIRQLGSGGMGRVWLAWDERIRRNVAVKEVLPRGGAEDRVDDSLRRTLREARAAAKLRHPGITAVHDVVDYDGRPWIIMDFIDGPSLASHLRDEGVLSVRRAAEIAIDVIEALNAAHENGVLHRDVKPSNIMLDKHGAVLTDFGIAALDGATVLTLTGQLMGSPEYIAPECIDGHEATPAADLWAVGITLYNLVIGDTPFRRARTSATLKAITDDKELDPHPSLGPLWPVIQGLLRKKPAERLTAEAAVEQLREVLGQPAAQRSVPSKPLRVLRLLTKTVRVTARNTRRAARAVPPSDSATGDVVRPGDVTLDPSESPPPSLTRRGKQIRVPVFVGGVALVVVVVVTVVFANGGHDIGGVASPASSVQPPLPAFTADRESLGFSITVPANYARHASTVDTVSDVVWQAPQPDPDIGTLRVHVQRDDTKPGTRPIDYLLAQERDVRVDSNNFDYRRLNLSGPGDGPAVWEYTHGSANGGDWFHVRALAVAGGNDIFVLTFSLYAKDMSTLQNQWQAAQSIMTRIQESFRLTS